MKEKDLFLKSKKKLVVLLLIYLSVAFVCIGLAFFIIFSNKGKEALNLSELVLNGNEKEGQYVALDIDTLPILVTPNAEKDSQFYFVTDVSNHIYIVNLSKETFKSIVGTLGETGKLNSTYQLKGITGNIDEQIKNLVLYNSYKVFKNNELNSDNFSEYLGKLYVKENFLSDRVVTGCKILVLFGIFILVIGLVYIVPALIRINKGNFGIYDEKKMMQALEKNVPNGETLTTGIYGIGIQSEIKQIFGKCIFDGDKFIPNENGTATEVRKCKYSRYEVYIGITQHYLILSECEAYKHYYEFNDIPDLGGADVREIDTCISIEDIGTCFPLAEIQKCEIKKAGKGAANCSITMKNGSLLKLRLPKSGGLGMPHHEENREAIIELLSANNV